ncbi:Uncharacterised protein family (UPF0158) [Pustulibacterium marinum]|uniref:Uncharacterized protein family (UPF0158) n=1 Tax=Pustulibacterium marinum TaxID=1224947 RepID=A0A1I7IBB5_9FLAO|nr:UPF0158 family protein [Pustulibacterium marinum]SFU70116.1 Uncharacterised protein family (UPF0158) [Pustulibacterium marinum]
MTAKEIATIAEELDCGMVCFYHRATGTIESYPDPNDIYFDPEPWQDIIDTIEAREDEYDKFEKMNSSEAFRVMEGFAASLTDAAFQESLEEVLANRKPFQHFKALVDASAYRQNWFDYKQNAYIAYVKDQL